MIHEATHAWQQFSLDRLGNDPDSDFSKDPSNVVFDPINKVPTMLYHQSDWWKKYGALLEVQAWDPVFEANATKRICLSQSGSKIFEEQKSKAEKLSENLSIPGIGTVVPLAGKP